MYQYQLGANVGISPSVHRELNDVVGRMTNNRVSGWEGNYNITLGLDGKIDAQATEQNNQGLSFETGITKKLAFLPTPVWVHDSEQKGLICFVYEIEGYMSEWWKQFARRL